MALGASALLCRRSQWECRHFQVEAVTIRTPKLAHRQTLVFLTDLHDQVFGTDNAPLLAAIRAERPDAILIGGDMMVAKHNKTDLTQTERILQKLVQIAPVYYAYGNHEARLEWDEPHYGPTAGQLQAMLKKYGVVVLKNSSACLPQEPQKGTVMQETPTLADARPKQAAHAGGLRISGLNLEKEYYDMRHPAALTPAGLTAKLGGADNTRFQILLAHTPVFADAYYRWGADLTLCGHFHGGVVRLPGLGAVITPQERPFHPYGAGAFHRGNRHILVGRGLGTHSLNVRLNNRPQLLVIHLTPQTKNRGKPDVSVPLGDASQTDRMISPAIE